MINVINADTEEIHEFFDSTGWRDALVSAAMIDAKISVSNPSQRPKFDARVRLTKYGATLNGWWVKRM